MSRSDDVWPTCDACLDGDCLFCLTLTVHTWCQCPCAWIWPDGTPAPFWLTTPTDTGDV